MAKELGLGSQRIKSSDYRVFEKKSEDLWDVVSDLDSSILDILELYLNNDNLDLIEDLHDDSFLRGSLSPDNKICGARVMCLPCGRKLARAGFSLFAKDLRFNSDSSRLWDVCYTNASGSKTYLYGEDKVILEQNKKLRLVMNFEENYLSVIERCESDIQTNCNNVVLGLYALLRTFIRVGNLEYFKCFDHKGLTCMQKKDISFDNNFVAFDFVGKDGVPQFIEKEFPEFFVKEFKSLVEGLKNDDDFVFTNPRTGHVLHSDDFSKLLFSWTGEHYYPHIIRSHYADMKCKEFLKSHRSATKEEVEEVFMEIAENLGHKRFNKKNDCWEINFSVTLKNYIHPSFSEKMIALYSKK